MFDTKNFSISIFKHWASCLDFVSPYSTKFLGFFLQICIFFSLGDALHTALNIAKECGIITDSIIVVSANLSSHVPQQLQVTYTYPNDDLKLNHLGEVSMNITKESVAAIIELITVPENLISNAHQHDIELYIYRVI